MIGKLLGKALSLPVRAATVPLRLIDPSEEPEETGLLSAPFEGLAEAIEDACEAALPEDD